VCVCLLTHCLAVYTAAGGLLDSKEGRELVKNDRHISERSGLRWRQEKQFQLDFCRG
jgi:hypothetical protein